MRKIDICFLILLLLTGCYGVEEQELTPLAELTIGNPTDVINADLGIELVFDAQVSSANDQTVKYEWAYGTPNPSSSAVYPIKGDLKVISTDPNIRYTFTRVGNYIMRLKIDNGESIVFKFYTLNVNSGLDEGILILNTDDQDHSLLTFIKTRTPEGEEEGAQEIYEDIVGMINPGIEITKASISISPIKFRR
ncbi:MAG: PKD domain-containing protein [Coprobacter sp.]